LGAAWLCLLSALLLGYILLPSAQIIRGTPTAGGGVPVQVVKDPTGSVVVLAAVTIQDQGPFQFVLDTGASRTVIDRDVADRLQLEKVPAIPIATDVTGAVQATVVRLPQWQIGDVSLPGTVVASIDLSGPNAPAFQQLVGQRVDGLLRSDVLSSFGSVTIGYAAGTPTLGPAS
jgi:predicted aspartyl protease